MVDVVQTSLLHLENLANVIHKQMLIRKVLAVLHKDGVEIVQLIVIVQHVLITLQVTGKGCTNLPLKYTVWYDTSPETAAKGFLSNHKTKK